jgi:hypothetical protein
MKYTNVHNLPMSMAVMLATDNYEHDDRTNSISVTSLLKSTREVVLSSRIPPSESTVDISTLLASRMGTALHDALEKAWRNPNLPEVLASLGIPKAVIQKIRIDPEEHDPDMINIYLEKRTEKVVDNWIVSGQYDLVINGVINDLKSTGTFKFGKDSPEYKNQLSIYKWLNQEVITEPVGNILFWFKDWNKNYTMGAKKYPAQPILEQPITLMSMAETESFIKSKLHAIDLNMQASEQSLPQCTKEELWQGSTKYAYMSKPDAAKASKVFDSAAEAHSHLMSKGKGNVVVRPATPTKCNWCAAIGICSQAQGYINSGLLKVS